jgi:hypothetical protein
MRKEVETDSHGKDDSYFSQFCERASTQVCILKHYTYQFLRHETKLRLPHFATHLFIFSSVERGVAGQGTNYRGPASGRPDNVAHVFAFSAVSDAVR